MLQKPKGAKLGVEVLQVAVSMGEVRELVVKRITKGGVVDVWNQLAEEVSRILPGDRITRVNGTSMDVDAMVRELQNSREMAMSLTRRNSNIGGVEQFVHSCAMAMANAKSSTAVGGTSHDNEVTTPAPSSAPCSGDMTSKRSNDSNHAQTSRESPVTRFEVELEKRPGERLGIEVGLLTGDAFNGVLVDRVIQGNCIDRWNMRSRSPFRVKPLDVVRVKGVAAQGLLNPLDLCIDAKKVSFTVERFENRSNQAQPVNRPEPPTMDAQRGRIGNVLETLVNRNINPSTWAAPQQPRDDARVQSPLPIPAPPPLVDPQPASSGTCGGAREGADAHRKKAAAEAPATLAAPTSPQAEPSTTHTGMSLAQAVKMAALPHPSPPPAPSFSSRSNATQSDAAAPRRWVPKHPQEPIAEGTADPQAPPDESSEVSSSAPRRRGRDGRAEADRPGGRIAQATDGNAAVSEPVGLDSSSEGAAPSTNQHPSGSTAHGFASQLDGSGMASGCPDETDASHSAGSLQTKLLVRTAQLNDDDLVRLLKSALSQRPGLSAYVARAIKLLQE